jgi:DNA-binding transcriptional ArsR family regulator
MPVTSLVLVKWLRAAGESSRVRLMALCAEAPLSVSDLAQTLRQSEPRVSRHLKILCEAGLLERVRQGQWVQYRISGHTEATGFVRGLLAQLDRRDPQLQRDRTIARAAQVPGGTHGAESRLGRTLAAFVAGGLSGRLRTALFVGVAHPELLERLAVAALECTVITPWRRAAQSARALAERHGFVCRVLQSSGEDAGIAELARGGASFDAVLLDHPGASAEALGRVLEDARGVLAPGGRLWIFQPYEWLEGSRGRVVEHPLARLRRMLGAAGLVCERLGPVEADGEHVLAAVAHRAADDARAEPGTAAGALP